MYGYVLTLIIIICYANNQYIKANKQRHKMLVYVTPTNTHARQAISEW